MANRRIFRPLGELLPDQRLLANEGLVRAFGVAPVGGNYIRYPAVDLLGVTSIFGSSGFLDAEYDVYGFGLQQLFVSGLPKLYAYAGGPTTLSELDVGADTVTDRSRATGYTFISSPPGSYEMWWFTTFGDNVIATNLNNEVQYLPTPGSGLFANMITSTFKPQGRFVFPVKQNLFMIYCFLPATYDGIPAGTHQQLATWSMNDNIRAFGSESVDPALIGAGYQQNVGGDLGPIMAGIGGSFGIIFCSRGIVRVDGPPYEFRTIVEGDTTIYPYSVFNLWGDIYFWGVGGPSVLRGGEGPVERLLAGKGERSLLDNTTGFGADFAVKSNLGAIHISGAPDPANGLVRWSAVPKDGSYLDSGNGVFIADGVFGSILIDYSLQTQRFTVSKAEPSSARDVGEHLFLRPAPVDPSAPWGPFGQVRFVLRDFRNTGNMSERIAGYDLKSTDSSLANDMEFQTGFGRLDDNLVTRIVAIRPVWSNSAGFASEIEPQVEVQIHTKNKPWEDPTSSSVHSEINADGWVGTDSAVFGSLHSVSLVFSGTDDVSLPVPQNSEINEVEGIEIQYVVGGEYGA